jgi:DNA/RNA-binding domain of Phe-tRNA-synthetase-like protein
VLGVKKGKRVSVESLIKRVKKGGQLPFINPLVDLYNSISLKYCFPVGGEDLDKVEGDIHLTLAQGGEAFREFGAVDEDPALENEVVYKDDLGCLCRNWNWREADRTKLTEGTTNAIIVIESLTYDRLSEMKAALSEMQEMVTDFFGASCLEYIIDKSNCDVEIMT